MAKVLSAHFRALLKKMRIVPNRNIECELYCRQKWTCSHGSGIFLSRKDPSRKLKTYNIHNMFQNEPTAYREVFQREVLGSNYSIIYYMLRIMVPISVFMLVLSIVIHDDNHIILANSILSICSSTLLFLSFTCPPVKSDDHKFLARFIVHSTYGVVLFWGMHMAGYQSDNVIFVIDMVLAIFILAFQFMTRYQTVLVYYICAAAYLFLFTPYIIGAFDYVPKFLAPILVMILAFFLSRVFYNQFIDRFIMSEKLKERQENLTSELFKTLEKLQRTERGISMDIIKTLVKVLECYDTYTRGHSSNVADYAVQIAKEMKLHEDQIDEIMLCGLVHDIGKILIPVHLLNKRTTLSSEEFEVVKKHSQYGFDTLMEAKYLDHIAKIVLHHHERWDGSGYPMGLSHNEIPLGSQILMVADAWDAMTSERIYKKAKSFNEARLEVLKLKGKQFSPEVVNAFLNTLAASDVSQE